MILPASQTRLEVCAKKYYRFLRILKLSKHKAAPCAVPALFMSVLVWWIGTSSMKNTNILGHMEWSLARVMILSSSLWDLLSLLSWKVSFRLELDPFSVFFSIVLFNSILKVKIWECLLWIDLASTVIRRIVLFVF